MVALKTILLVLCSYLDPSGLQDLQHSTVVCDILARSLKPRSGLRLFDPRDGRQRVRDVVQRWRETAGGGGSTLQHRGGNLRRTRKSF